MKHRGKTFAMRLVVVLPDSFRGMWAHEKLCGDLSVSQTTHQARFGQGFSWRNAFNERFFNFWMFNVRFFLATLIVTLK